MIRINLLPFRAARQKENIRRQVSIFLLSLACLLIILFYYNWSLGHKIDDVNAQIKQTKTELDKFDKIIKEIESIKKKLSNLKKKMTVMQTLEANRFEPTRLMDTLTQVIVPKRMWFTSLHSKDNGVRITGIALDNKTVADFMVRLEKSGLFSDVNLNTLKQHKMDKSNFKSFQISCVKKPPVKTKTK
ncbi:Type IV pilus biogenesis protein PilN [Olavius sp. associated proteobacterium Delta 1]|nr:Type IV pilus biogenesis protein PilN [Olavius sp. associated proteobacterium Delta 1]